MWAEPVLCLDVAHHSRNVLEFVRIGNNKERTDPSVPYAKGNYPQRSIPLEADRPRQTIDDGVVQLLCLAAEFAGRANEQAANVIRAENWPQYRACFPAAIGDQDDVFGESPKEFFEIASLDGMLELLDELFGFFGRCVETGLSFVDSS